MKHTRSIALALATVASSPLMAKDFTWRISETSGTVQLLRAGLSTVAARGGTVQPGDTIVTGRGSRAVVARGEEYLMVAPSSQLRMPAAEQSSTITTIFQDFGNVVFMIKQKMTPHFAVSTPYLAAVVKGTTFSVSVSDTGTAVQVIEGAVDVATADGGARELLKPGAVAMVNALDRFRMRIEGDGVSRTITSPAIDRQEPSPQTVPAPSAHDRAVPAAVASNPVPGENVITSAIVEKPVSLAKATDGLVKGTIGGEVQSQFALASEASRAAGHTIHAATVSAAASQVAREAETARVEASAVSAGATEAVKAAEQASITAELASSAADESARALADATVAQAASDNAAAAAAARAAAAVAQARAAAADAARAAQEIAAREVQVAVAAAAALEAQRSVELARENSADPSVLSAANHAAEQAAKEAQRAAERALEAQADRLAREAARIEADKQAGKAANDAANAARDATDKAAEKAAREAAKAADETVREQAKQLAEAAKAAEKAAKDAAHQASKEAAEAAREAEKAAKDAEKAIKDAGKVADAIGTSGGSQGPGSSGSNGDHGHGNNGNAGTGNNGHSGKGTRPLEILRDLLSPIGSSGKGKN